MKNVDDISIEWNEGNSTIFIKLLIILGYPVYDKTDSWDKYWPYLTGYNGKFNGSKRKCKNHFTTIEDFLKYHFSKEETEQQRKVRQLEEKMEAHKATMKDLEEQIKGMKE